MKIGFVVDDQLYKDTRVYNQAKILMSQGFDVVFLICDFGLHKNIDSIDGISIRKRKINLRFKNLIFGLNNTLPLFEILWARAMKKFVRTDRPDILFVHDLYLSRATHWAVKKTKVPFILDLHENFPEAVLLYTWAITFPKKYIARPKAWARKEKKYLAYADGITLLSEHFKNLLLKRYSNLKPDNFCVFPNVPDINKLLKYPINLNIFERKSKFILCYFGFIAIRRGLSTVFEALMILKNKGVDINFLLVGPINRLETKYFDKYLDSPLKEIIIYFPYQDITNLPSLISSSDACISPLTKNDQHESGVANKVFQYMLFEKPLIVSNCMPQQTIVEEYNCGLVFEDGNVEDLVEKIEFLINNKTQRLEMGANSKKAVIEKYNIDNYAIDLKNFFIKIVNNS